MTTSVTIAGTTMRAIIQERYGEAENVLRLGQTGRPAIGDGEVLLGVRCQAGRSQRWPAPLQSQTGSAWPGLHGGPAR